EGVADAEAVAEALTITIAAPLPAVLVADEATGSLVCVGTGATSVGTGDTTCVGGFGRASTKASTHATMPAATKASAGARPFFFAAVGVVASTGTGATETMVALSA